MTGIKFEPWHFRYVGKEIASYIMANGMTLESSPRKAQEAVAEFESGGGDVEEQLAYEYSRLNAARKLCARRAGRGTATREGSLVF